MNPLSSIGNNGRIYQQAGGELIKRAGASGIVIPSTTTTAVDQEIKQWNWCSGPVGTIYGSNFPRISQYGIIKRWLVGSYPIRPLVSKRPVGIKHAFHYGICAILFSKAI